VSHCVKTPFAPVLLQHARVSVAAHCERPAFAPQPVTLTAALLVAGEVGALLVAGEVGYFFAAEEGGGLHG